jgi:hypothetical protein
MRVWQDGRSRATAREQCQDLDERRPQTTRSHHQHSSRGPAGPRRITSHKYRYKLVDLGGNYSGSLTQYTVTNP